MQKLKSLAFGASACAALLLGATAASADGYERGSIKDPCCDSWKGFYLGIHGGYGWKNDDFHEFLGTVGATQVFVGGIDSKGWLFGAQAGYNWQKGSLVGGLELDFSSTGIDGSSSPAVRNLAGVTITDIRGDDVKWLGSARGRLGFTSGGCCSNLLFYATAGLAWERFERTDTTTVVVGGAGGFTQTAVTTIPNDRFGWVAGLGAEAKVGGTGWIGRVEYLHYDFGTSNTTTVVTQTFPGGFTESASNQRIDVIRAGLSYKF
jgi:outer membrane immunogenic protein